MKMNCIKCYQEIPEGSRFCPHCGAQQPEPQNSGSESVNMETQPDVNIGPEADAQTAQENPYQENSYQEEQNYNSSYQNQSYYGGYQNNNSSYQTPPSYQTGGQQPSVNWVPYLVLSIISTVCCCIPFGIVAIVYAVKINNAVTAGDMEEANRAARTAKIWIILAIVIGLIVDILLFMLYGRLIYEFGGDWYYYY